MTNMKNIFISKPFWLIVAAFLILVPSALAQTADLSATITSPTAGTTATIGQSVSFAATATGGTSPYFYSWDFGDGSQGVAGPTADHSYSAAGSYNVVLTASDFANPAANAQASVTVTISTPAGNPLNVSITSPANNTGVSTGQAVSFSATATGGTSPYFYSWNFGDGSEGVAGPTANHSYATAGTYNVVVTASDFANPSANAQASVSVIATAGTTTPQTLTISNLRVTDIGTDRATVRWTTNLAADSRVIYDTVSHPDISTATPPNFSYANSTSTMDTGTLVTEHAVTVTGLAPSTQYFFRALSQRP